MATSCILKETYGKIETAFGEVKTKFVEIKPTYEKVEPTYDCGDEVESTFGDKNPICEKLGLTLL